MIKCRLKQQIWLKIRHFSGSTFKFQHIPNLENTNKNSKNLCEHCVQCERDVSLTPGYVSDQRNNSPCWHT